MNSSNFPDPRGKLLNVNMLLIYPWGMENDNKKITGKNQQTDSEFFHCLPETAFFPTILFT